jgi:hypothetical protein
MRRTTTERITALKAVIVHKREIADEKKAKVRRLRYQQRLRKSRALHARLHKKKVYDRARWASRMVMLALERKQRSAEGAQVFKEWILALHSSVAELRASTAALKLDRDAYEKSRLTSVQLVTRYAAGFVAGQEAMRQEMRQLPPAPLPVPAPIEEKVYPY